MPWTGTDPSKWVEKVKDAPLDAIKMACFQTFSNVVLTTPVDTGAARGSWLCSLDQPAEGEGEPDKSGRATIDRIQAVLATMKGDQSVFLASNLPYIKMLEFGGYGKERGQGKSLVGRKFPGRGLGRKVNKIKIDRSTAKGEKAAYQKWLKDHATKITRDGHSLQSPNGMVGLAMQKFQEHLQKAINSLSEG